MELEDYRMMVRDFEALRMAIKLLEGVKTVRVEQILRQCIERHYKVERELAQINHCQEVEKF